MKQLHIIILSCVCLLLVSASLFAEISLVGSLDLGDWSPSYIAKSGNVVYLGTNFQYKALFIDVSNPAQPRLANEFDFGMSVTLGADMVGDLAYICSGAAGLSIVDVGDPDHPEMLSTTPLSYSPTQCVDVVGNWAYVSIPSVGQTGVHAVDVSDPAHPVVHGRYPRTGAYGIEVHGNYCHIAGHYVAGVNYGGYSIPDISNPDNMVGVGGLIDPPWYCVDVAVIGNYAYLTEEAGQDLDGTYGIRIVDISDIANNVVVGFYELERPPSYMVTWYENIIVASPIDGIFVFDASDPENLTLTGSYGEEGASDVVTDGHYAYVPGADHFLVLDISSVLNAPADMPNSPEVFAFNPAYPNPFNAVTNISYSVPSLAPVTLTIHTISGELVSTLVDGAIQHGEQQLNWNAAGVPTGTYIIRLDTPQQSVSQKVMLVK
jgi:hypothetical protein